MLVLPLLCCFSVCFTSANFRNVRDLSGNFRDFGKNDDEKNRFLFLYLRVKPKATFVD